MLTHETTTLGGKCCFHTDEETEFQGLTQCHTKLRLGIEHAHSTSRTLHFYHYRKLSLLCLKIQRGRGGLGELAVESTVFQGENIAGVKAAV